MPTPLLTPQELADWLKMSRVWVYKQAKKGLLPFHRVGEAIRFDPEEIRVYLNERKGIKKNYSESRNPKRRSKETLLAPQQEAAKTD